VEAKREGEYFELPAGVRKREYAISSLCRDYDNLAAAIRQAIKYCQRRGVPIGVVCNGHQVVAFIATRSDGVAPLEGRALVFPSIEDMVSDFLAFWNSLSKPGIIEGNLETRLMGRVPSPIPLKLSAQIVGYPGIKGRNTFQTDLQIVSDLVLEDLARGEELEDEFLRNCYCSSGALSQYALISKDILRARYQVLFAGTEGPSLEPVTTKEGISSDLVANGLSRRPILLIGDVGVGKTTFIRYLVKIKASDVFRDALTIYLDLGSQGALAKSLKDFILEEIQKQLRESYAVDVEERNFVRGVYHRELMRFGSGVYADLKEVDLIAYRRKEIEFLEERVCNKDTHLQASITHVARGRRKQVVIFLDNADQRVYEVQQEAFLIAQDLASNWPATVFVALRPETFYKSLRSGALSGYHPRAFTISPPRIDDVIHNRLSFGLRLASGDIPISSLPDEIKVKFDNLATIIKAFQESLHYTDELMTAIDNISVGNVRKALDLVKCFFGSGHVDTAKIVRIYQEEERYYVPLHEFLRAVIYGDNIYFDPSRSPISNLLDISTNDPKEHFIIPMTLGFVISLADRAHKEGFVDTKVVYDMLQHQGYTPQQIDSAFFRVLIRKLVESGSAEERDEIMSIPQAVRITTSGAYHLHRLLRKFIYIDAVVVDTPILNENARRDIRDVSDIQDRLDRSEIFLSYLDTQWERSNIRSDVLNWDGVSADLKDDIAIIKRRLERKR
jgi:GTPase SAR1 family protein